MLDLEFDGFVIDNLSRQRLIAKPLPVPAQRRDRTTPASNNAESSLLIKRTTRVS